MQKTRKRERFSVGLLLAAGALAVLGCRLGTPQPRATKEAGFAAAHPMSPGDGVSHRGREDGNVRIRFHSIPAHAAPPCASCHVEPGVGRAETGPAQCGACHEEGAAQTDGQ
jgi:hypothetical protein